MKHFLEKCGEAKFGWSV